MTELSQNEVMTWSEADIAFMQQALGLAKKAADLGEVPVGSVVVRDGTIIGQGWNLRETRQNPIQHAEIMAIEEAAKNSASWRLSGTTLYVTLEPCLMCAGAIYQARIDRVIYGATDPKAGACGSLYHVHEDARLNHRFLVKMGLLAQESSDMLKLFFRERRPAKSTTPDDGA